MNTYTGKGRTPGAAALAAYQIMMEKRGNRNGVVSHSFIRAFWGTWYCVLVA